MDTLAQEKSKRVVGFYICWGCHQFFTLYEGQKRKYCDGCLPGVKKAGGGVRHKGKQKPS